MKFEINPHFGVPPRVRFWINDQEFELAYESLVKNGAKAPEQRELAAMLLKDALSQFASPAGKTMQPAVSITGSATIREIEDALAERGFFARYWLSPERAKAELRRTRSNAGQLIKRGVPDDRQLVRVVPTEEQWSGLARALVLAFDMQMNTPAKLIAHLRESGLEAPQWLLDEPSMRHLDRSLSRGTRCVLIYRAMLEDAPVETAFLSQDPLVPLAFDIADESMMALLQGLGIPIADHRIGLCSVDGDEVQSISEADPAIREAFVWLCQRGRACLEQDKAGHSVVLVDAATN